MLVANAIAEVLKREKVKFIIGYPVNPIIEAAAEADIRTIIVRQERVGLHMADAVSRLSSGDDIGVFVMQHGPGAENAFGGVAQAYSESVPILVMPAGYQRRLANYFPNFNGFLPMERGLGKSIIWAKNNSSKIFFKRNIKTRIENIIKIYQKSKKSN